MPIDDYAGDSTTTGAVGTPGQTYGVLETPGDVDWFAVTIGSGYYYANFSSVTGGLSPHIVGIYDANEELIPYYTSGTLQPGNVLAVGINPGLTPGTYYIAVTDTLATGPVSYQLGFENMRYWAGPEPINGWGPEDEHEEDAGPVWVVPGASQWEMASGDDYSANTTKAGALYVTAGFGSETGTIGSAEDIDWFTVSFAAGKTYVIRVEGAANGGGTIIDPSIWGIYGTHGDYIVGTANDDDGITADAEVTFHAQANGQFRIAVASSDGGTGTYTVSVSEVDLGNPLSDDFEDAVATTGTVTVGGSATGGVQHSGDSDWFAVTLSRGETYQIDLRGQQSDGGTLVDPKIGGIFGADGSFFRFTDNEDFGGLDARVTFTAPVSGTYYIGAGAQGLGTYTLSVEEVGNQFAAPEGDESVVNPGDDYSSDSSDTGANNGAGATEVAGDIDWFALSLSAATDYWIEHESYDVGYDEYIVGVYDSAGNYLGNTTSASGRLVFTPATTDTYYVAVTGEGGSTGTYAVGAHPILSGVPGQPYWVTPGLSPGEFVAGDDHAPGAGSTGHVYLTGGAGTDTGTLEVSNDVDRFGVALTKDTAYVIRVEGAANGGGTLADPRLFGIYHPDTGYVLGTRNDSDGASADAELVFLAPSSGTYQIAVDSAVGGTGSYTVEVAAVPGAGPGSDDFADSISTTGTVTVGSSAIGGIQFNGEQDWFAVTLTEGSTYAIRQRGWVNDFGTLVDPTIRGIYSADGTFYADTRNNDFGDLDAQITFTAPTTGTYFIAAAAYSHLGLGTYTVSVDEVFFLMAMSAGGEGADDEEVGAASSSSDSAAVTEPVAVSAPASAPVVSAPAATTDTVPVTETVAAPEAVVAAEPVSVAQTVAAAETVVAAEPVSVAPTVAAAETVVATEPVTVAKAVAATGSGSESVSSASEPVVAFTPEPAAPAVVDLEPTSIVVQALSAPVAAAVGGIGAKPAEHTFTAATTGVLNAHLSGMSGNLDLTLIETSTGKSVARSRNGGSSDETLSALVVAGTTYTVQVAGVKGAASTYTLDLPITAIPEGELDNNFQVSAQVLDTSATTTFQAAVGAAWGDKTDFYKFTAQSSGLLTAGLSGMSGDLNLTFYDAAGKAIRPPKTTGSADESVTALVVAGQSYGVQVQPTKGVVSDYTLTLPIAALPAGEPDNNAFATAPTIDPSLAVSASVGATWGDKIDYYKFTAPVSGVLNASLAGMSGDLSLFLLDESGARLKKSQQPGTADESLTHLLTAGQTYAVQIQPGKGVVSDYTLNLPITALPDGEPANNLLATAPTIASEGTFSADVGASWGDKVDYFRFTAAETGRLTAQLSGMSGDLDLLVTNAAGKAVARSQLLGTADELASGLVTAGEEYFVRITPKKGVVSDYILQTEIDSGVFV